MEDLGFEVSFVKDVGGVEWLCFRLLNGEWVDHVLFLSGLDDVEQFSFSLVKLNPNGGNADVVEVTEDVVRLAISFKDFFLENREKVLDILKKSMYNVK